MTGEKPEQTSRVNPTRPRLIVRIEAGRWWTTRRCAALAVALASLVLFTGAASASADSLSVTATPTSVGAGQTVTVTASGQASEPDPDIEVYLTPASAGCAPTLTFMPEDTVDFQFPNQLGPGAFSVAGSVATELDTQFDYDQDSTIQGPTGPYLACGYLEEYDDTTGLTTNVTASAQVTLRYPSDSLTLEPSFHAVADQTITIPIGYDVEPGTVDTFMFVHAEAGSSCGVYIGDVVGKLSPGQHTLNWQVKIYKPGTFTLCVTARGYEDGDPLVFASATSQLSVIAQTSATNTGCHVPNVVGDTLARARRALKQDHCRVGALARRTGGTHKPGTVISQSAQPGRHLPDGARISLVLVAGPVRAYQAN
jgi:PASTA domain